MKTFNYKAINWKGHNCEGSINSNTIEEARESLKQQKIFTVSISIEENNSKTKIVLNVCRKSNCKHYKKSWEQAIISEKCKYAGIIKYKIKIYGGFDYYDPPILPKECPFDTEHIVMQYSIRRGKNEIENI